MPNDIKPLRSFVPNLIPLASEISEGELAVNWNDGRLFTKDSEGNIVAHEIGGTSSGGAVSISGGSANIVEADTAAGFPATGSAGTLYHAINSSRIYFYDASGVYVEAGTSGGGGSGLTWSSVPASATATGTAGEIAYDGSYLYAATAQDSWKRASLSSWDSYYSSVSLLLPMDGNNNSTVFTDYGPSSRTVTANNDAKISTSQSKFGGASAFFDGTGDYLSVANSSAFDFGSGDFAIEAWIYIAANGNADPDGNKNSTICNTWNTGSPTASGWEFGVLGNSTTTGIGLQMDSWNATNATLFRATYSISQSAWHYVAASVVSGVRRLYLDGVLLTNTQTITVNSGYTQVNSVGSNLRIGNSQNTSYPNGFNGYIDDLRITKGVGRGYTGSTIPIPAAAFPRL